MCGRFTLTGSLIWLFKLLSLSPIANLTPRYNIAPGQPVLVFLHNPDSNQITHDYQLWGLIPSFNKDPKVYKPLINARAETLGEKPSFKKAFQYRRCVIPASGFYEWQKVKDGKQPWYFCHSNPEKNFCFAGIWDIWHGPDGEQVNSFAIITTAANQLVNKIHPRMPVILSEECLLQWLDPATDTIELKKMLVGFPPSAMKAWKVDRQVNNPKFDSPECLQRSTINQPELF
jgi:putative SOS response-associated peptidase YedK